MTSHVPERTCVGCRTKRPQAALLRVALGPDGGLLVSRTAPGRGAWLCRPAQACLQTARKQRGLDKAFRRRFEPAAIEQLMKTLREG